jgi:hypothetical protein
MKVRLKNSTPVDEKRTEGQERGRNRGGLINCFFSIVNKFEDQIKSDDEKKYTKKKEIGD